MEEKIELEWLARWKGSFSNPTKKPCQVMKAYINLLDILVDALDKKMCWECWPEANWPEEFAETT
jgi:hypothetical protein